MKNKFKKISYILTLLAFISCTNQEVVKPKENQNPIKLEKKEVVKKVEKPQEIKKEEKVVLPVIEKTIEKPVEKLPKVKTVEKSEEKEKVDIEKEIIKPIVTEDAASKKVEVKNKEKEKKQIEKKEKLDEKIDAASVESEKKELESVEKLMNNSKVKNASIGIKVMDLDTDKVLYEKNSKSSLTPASNMKIVTTGLAIETLGKDFRFKTYVTYKGKIDENGVLNGDIYIIGGGDPTLGSKYLVAKNPERVNSSERKKQIKFIDTWVEKVKEMGIKKINGEIIADPSYYPLKTLSPTWEWGDLRYEFGSPANGLTFYDNNIRLTLRRENSQRVRSSITPNFSRTKIVNRVAPGRNSSITLVSVPYSNEIITLGTLNGNAAYYTTTMKDPESSLARLFSEKLTAQGIENKDGRLALEKEKTGTTRGKKVIYTNYSPTLEKIISYTNKYSVNLFAEHIKREIEKEKRTSIKNLWKRKGIDVDGLHMYDGSGLSRYDGVSPEIIVDILKDIKNSNEFEPFYNSLAKPLEGGTFQTFDRRSVLVKNLHGKSGTLTGIKAYSGYMHNEKGDLLGFSIIVNHHGLSNSAMSKELEEVMKSFYYLK